MDLRTKLVFALVAVSLASMLALGLLSYGPARDLLRRSALDGLEAVAASKRSDIDNVHESWRDRVHLIVSRTQLRLLVERFNATHDPSLREPVVRILRDAQESVPQSEVREITVYDTDLHPLATTRDAGLEAVEALDPSRLPVDGEAVSMEPIRFREVEELEARFLAPLRLEGVPVGTALIRMSGNELLEVTNDYTGLGRTGETLLSITGEDGRPVIVNRPRHGSEALPVRPADPRDPSARVLQGVERTFDENAVDYRGERVWAATRYLPELGLGLVVKFDATEKEEPLRTLRGTMVRMSLSLSGFAILVGILLGLHFAGPIHDLAEAAERIRHGELDVRAPVRGEDEISRLAEAFNEMTEKLVETNRELQRRIAEGGGGSPRAERPGNGPD